jgi:copper chaperone CopZ
MKEAKYLEVPIDGMDCMECTQHVQRAIAALPGVKQVDVFLASEKAVIQLDPSLTNLPAIRRAVEGAGYSVPQPEGKTRKTAAAQDFTRQVLGLSAIFDSVLFIGGGNGLGLFEALTIRIPGRLVSNSAVAGCQFHKVIEQRSASR